MAMLASVQADPACPTADPPKDACNVAVVAQCSSIWHPSHVDLPTLSSYSDVPANHAQQATKGGKTIYNEQQAGQRTRKVALKVQKGQVSPTNRPALRLVVQCSLFL